MDRGPATITWTGRFWYFTGPRPEDVHAGDWVGLAYVNRFGGAAGAYSVLEHQVRCVWQAEDLGLPVVLRRALAVHDAPEAYPPGDVLGPVVAYLRQLAAETRIVDPILAMRDAAENAVFTRADVLDVFRDTEQARIVHAVDTAMAAAEKRSLVRGCRDLQLPAWAPTERIVPMSVSGVLEEYRSILRTYAPELVSEFLEGVRL